MAEKVQVNADKLKVLNAVMEKIEKDFGKGSIMRMNSQEVSDVPVIPTGSITLDIALGVGGYPKGRVVEIYGPESSGKTTLAIHAIAEAQKAGGIAAFIDAVVADSIMELGKREDDLSKAGVTMLGNVDGKRMLEQMSPQFLEFVLDAYRSLKYRK
mgnify:CR=1 FL=1